MNIGGFNRTMYDECAAQQRIYESTSPYNYRTYGGAYENCKKCVYDKFWKPTDGEVVDRESDLLNLGRPTTKCSQFKYNPTCDPSSSKCKTTFDKSNPVIFDRVCSVVHSNIPVQKNPGYELSYKFCKK